MNILGAEKMSRLVVGVITLVLIGGLVAFFSGSLDSIFGSKAKTANKSLSAKMAPAVPDKAPSSNTAKVTIEVAAKTPTPAPTSPPAQNTATAIAQAPQPPASNTIETKAKTKQARRRDLDLRSCLDLASDIEIAHCAYQAP